MKMTKEEFKKAGGAWLGEVRSWMQWNCNNGERVTWGSNTPLTPSISVKQLEDVAGDVAYKTHTHVTAKVTDIINTRLDNLHKIKILIDCADKIELLKSILKEIEEI